MRLFILFLLVSPVWVFAQGLNAGFVQGLWYSKTPFFAGDAVRIYTAIQNNSGFDITGTVEFLVNDKVIGESSFSALQGRIIETWADWKVPEGNHSVSARVKQAFKVEIGKSPEPILLSNASLGASQVFADQDTDKDGVGNLEDANDDNDGFTDEQEKELGTNPLQKDAPKAIAEIHESESAKEPAKAETLVQEVSQKVAQEYLPAIEEKLDSLAQGATEKLKEKKAELQEKKQAYETGEKEEALSLPEQGLDLLLAAGIAALPQWQIGVFLSFAIAAALLLRRLFRKEQPQKL